MNRGLLLLLVSVYSLIADELPQHPLISLVPSPGQLITTLDIAEDAAGDLWLAAEEGVFRFDGRHYTKIPGGIVHPMSIAVLGGETILIGAENGLYRYENGVLVQLSQAIASRIIKVNVELALVWESRRGLPNPWLQAVALSGEQLKVYDQGEKPTGYTYAAAGGLLWSTCGSSICSVDSGPALLEAAQRGKLEEYLRRQSHRVTELSDVELPFAPWQPGFDGWYLARVQNGAVLHVFKPGLGIRTFNVGTFARAMWIPNLYPDRHSRMWIPGDYLWVWNGGKAQKFEPREFIGKQVNAVYEDSHGRTWFGLRLEGLAVMNREPRIESWTSPEAGDEINALARQDANTLYAATYKGVLFRKRSDADWSTVAAPVVNQIAPGVKGKLMGLKRLGPPVELSEEGRVLAEIPIPVGTIVTSFRRLVRAPDGSYYLGGQQQEGLYRIGAQGADVVELPAGSNGNVQDIEFDSQGAAFVAFDGGVCRMDGKRCVAVIGVADGLLSRKVRSIGIPIGQNPVTDIWVAYRDANAFTRLTRDGSRWTARHFTSETGFETPETMYLRRDRRGWVWRGSGDGLWVADGVHVEPGDWIRLTEMDGLPSRFINRFGFLEDVDGSVWIGAATGIGHIHPSPEWFNNKRPVRLTSITYGTDSFADARIFPHRLAGLSTFTMRFTGPELLPVRYRLLPRDSDWRLNRTGDVRYDKLETGHYQLQSTTGQGGPVDEYSFEVTDPAGMRRKAAIGCSLFAVSLGLLAGFKRRTVKRRELERRVLPDLSELRLSALAPDAQRLLGVPLDSRFTPQHVILRGSFTTVFEGFDEEQQCRCAVKVFHRELAGQGFSRSFRQEVSALETLAHPNVVRIYGHGATPSGVPYLVMEFIEGNTLRVALETGGLPYSRVASLLRQAGSALATMHSHGIYHRDLKPENLMLRENGTPGDDLVLIDFSIAIVKRADQTVQGLTRLAGTLEYMPPEQVMGYADAASDIYSLAKVTIELITGKRLSELLPDAALDMPVRVREVMSRFQVPLSPASVELLSSALEFDPVRRPQDVARFAGQIAADLESAN